MALPCLSSALYRNSSHAPVSAFGCPNMVLQVLTALADRLSLEETARLFELEPETAAQWLALAANHFGALPAYMSHNLELEQVQ